MSTPVKKSSLNLTRNNKIVLGLAIALVLALATYAVASGILSNPAEENVTGTPTDKPTATTTPLSTVPTEVHLSSNVTAPWYKTDFLEMTAQLNTPTEGITITLLNHGDTVVTALTDDTGKAVFVRNPQNPFDYSVTATIP